MDFKNKSIPLESITSFDVNKAIQRSLTKACARHGLGLYIYAGEDLPETETQTSKVPEKVAKNESQISKVPEKLFIDISQTTEETQLLEIWNKNPELHKNVDFKTAIINQKDKLNEQK